MWRDRLIIAHVRHKGVSLEGQFKDKKGAHKLLSV